MTLTHVTIAALVEEVRIDRAIYPAGIASGEALGAPIVAGPITVGAGIPSGEDFGIATVTTGDTVVAFVVDSDTIRGGKIVHPYLDRALINTSRDTTFTGTTLPAGWTTLGIALTPTATGLKLNTGVGTSATSGVQSPHSDYAHYDASLYVVSYGPPDDPGSTITLCALENYISATEAVRVALRWERGALRIVGEVMNNGVVIFGGSVPATTPVYLRLVRNGAIVYTLCGVRTPSGWTEETPIFGPYPFGTEAGGSVRIYAANGTTNRAVQARITDYIVESHLSINDRLVRMKQVPDSHHFSGQVPAATLAEQGSASISAFGLFGAATDPDGFTYTLPAGKTVGNEVVRRLRIYQDPSVRDGE